MSWYYNLVGPASYMQSIIDQNIVMRRMTIYRRNSFHYFDILLIWIFLNLLEEYIPPHFILLAYNQWSEWILFVSWEVTVMERSVAHCSTQLQCCALFHICRCNWVKTLPFYKMNMYMFLFFVNLPQKCLQRMMDLLKHFMCLQVADSCFNQSLLFVLYIADQTPWSSFFLVKHAVLVWSINDTTYVEPKVSLPYWQ
jgi:hypothetical protein